MFIVALFGLLSAVEGQKAKAAQPGSQTQQQMVTALKRIDRDTEKLGGSGDLNKRCGPRQENRDSQLCAYWKAADEAERSADWSRNTFWLGIAEAIVASLALTAAALAASYAKKAAIYTKNSAFEARRSNRLNLLTERRSRRRDRESSAATFTALLHADSSARAAARHAEISEDTAKRQLRAYILISHVRMSDISNYPMNIPVTAINNGETPAYGVHHIGVAIVMPTMSPGIDSVAREQMFASVNKAVTDAPVGKGQNLYLHANCFDDLSNHEHRINLFEQLKTGQLTLHIFGRIKYHDIYRCKWNTDYHVFVGGRAGVKLQKINEETLILPALWDDGNEAT